MLPDSATPAGRNQIGLRTVPVRSAPTVTTSLECLHDLLPNKALRTGTVRGPNKFAQFETIFTGRRIRGMIEQSD